MRTVIEWCNCNNGFLAGLLSLITGIISVIAVFVSAVAARIPYRKKMKIGSATNILFQKDLVIG